MDGRCRADEFLLTKLEATKIIIRWSTVVVMTCGVIPVIFIICAGSLINHLDVINRSDSGGWG